MLITPAGPDHDRRFGTDDGAERAPGSETTIMMLPLPFLEQACRQAARWREEHGAGDGAMLRAGPVGRAGWPNGHRASTRRSAMILGWISDGPPPPSRTSTRYGGQAPDRTSTTHPERATVGRIARFWFVATAVGALVALAMQIPISAGDVDGDFDTPAARVANLFTLFTVLTSLVVAASCLQCAVRPGLRSTLWRTVRVDAVLGIVIVAAVYHTLLAGLHDLQGTEVVVNLLWHTVVPIATVLGWLVFGPRGHVDVRVVAWSVVFPLVWLAFTLVRGAAIGWYPYPFVDVEELGYARVALNCLGITALFLALAVALLGVDRVLSRGRPRLPERDRGGGARIGA